MIKLSMSLIEFNKDAKIILNNLSQEQAFELATSKTQSFFVYPTVAVSLTRNVSYITGYSIKEAGAPDSELEVVSL